MNTERHLPNDRLCEVGIDFADLNVPSGIEIFYLLDDWIFCSGRKMAEIYGDPVALDGAHFLPADFQVKADFSEYSVIEGEG